MSTRSRLFGVVAVSLALLASCDAGGVGGLGLGAATHDAPVAIAWRWHAPRPASVGAPGADSTAVAVTYAHTKLVLFASDGRVIWEAERLGLREQAPVLTPDLVVAPTDDGLVAFDRASGAVRWDTAAGRHASAPVLADGLAFTTFASGSVVAFDMASGHVLWRRDVPGRTDGPPATDGETVVVSWEEEHGDAAGLVALDAASGKERWAEPLEPGGVGGPGVVMARDAVSFVVVVDDDLQAKAFEMADGHRRWAAKVGGAGSPEVVPLALSGGRVLVADRLAGLTLFDDAGKEQWSARVDEAAVRGGAAGPALGGRYALVLVDGTFLLAGPGRGTHTVQPPGGVANGVARGAGGALYVSTAQGSDNQLVAYRSDAVER